MSLDVKMAWRNVWRNPRRSILTMLAIAFASMLLVFMLSWQFGSYATMINSSVMVHTGHLQVQAGEYQEKKEVHLVVPNPGAVNEILANTNGVVAYGSRANAFSLVSSANRTYGAMVIGIEPEKEAKISTLAGIIREGEYLSSADTNQALIGELLAGNLQVHLGDELVLLGQGRDGSIAATVVQVKGMFSSGQDEYDRSMVHIPLEFFQDVYSMNGSVHEMVIVAESLEAVPEIKKEISAKLADLQEHSNLVVLDWKQLMPGLIQAIKMDLVSGFIFYIILVVVVAFSILNTFLMAILERTREFGIMMAIGTAPNRLTKILLLESAGMTLMGLILGVLLGSLVTWYFQIHGIVISGTADIMRQYGLPERMFPALSILSICVGAGVVFLITILAALYPALKVRRLRPVEAISST